MDFESPDVAKEFPGLYASDHTLRQSQERDSDYSDDGHEKPSKKDLLIGKRKEKRDSKKDKGYMAFEGESSGEDQPDADLQKSPTKSGRKSKSAFKFSKRDKPKEKSKEKRDEKDNREKEIKNKEKREDKDREKEKEKKKKKKSSKVPSVKLKLKDRKKSKHGDEDGGGDKDDRPIFGVPLAVAVERSKCHDGIELPAIVRECIDYIEEHGLSCEGIYRLSGVKSKVQKLRNQYNRGEQVCLFEHEPHIVASLLKLFLRELPDPVLTHQFMPMFEDTSALKDERKKSDGLRHLIDELPLCNRLLLSWVFVHMQHIIQREKVNKMNVQNVSIVLSPTMQVSHRVLNALFNHATSLFGHVLLKKYVPPLRPETSRLSLELPDTPTAIQDEIVKQESLLAQLHAEMFSGLADRDKEEQLWEVQRVVTQLKRKLRFAKRAQQVEKDEAEASRVVAKASESFNEDNLSLDTRLADASAHQHSVNVVEHKCVVYVPWQQPTVAPADEIDSGLDVTSISNVAQVEVDNVCEVSVTGDSSTVVAREPIKATSNEKVTSEEVAVEAKDEHGVQDVEDATPQATARFDYDEEEERSSDDEEVEDDETCLLRMEERSLLVEQEELSQLSEELRRKIETERLEVDRLRSKISDLRALYECRRNFSPPSYNVDYNNSDDDDVDVNNSSSSVDDDATNSDGEEDSDVVVQQDDEESMRRDLGQLETSNQRLQVENAELIERIERERAACLAAKVNIRLILCRQQEASASYRSVTVTHNPLWPPAEDGWTQ